MSEPHIPVELIHRLRSARRVAVLTGAGISAESGVPTFREAQTGLWAQYNPEELATPDAFRRNPQLVWDWYLWRQERVRLAEPNPGHLADHPECGWPAPPRWQPPDSGAARQPVPGQVF